MIVPLTAPSIAPEPPPSSLGITTEKSPVYPVPESVTVADVIVPPVTMSVSYTHLTLPTTLTV